MRKIFFLILAVLTLSASARRITNDEAFALAREFFSSPTALKSTEERVSINRAVPKNVSNNSPQPYYIFNADNNDGFVIISGDDRARKILGYSNKGTFNFDNLPPQLSSMLEDFSMHLNSLSESATMDPSWKTKEIMNTDLSGVLLETANWGQGYPYNLHTPVINGEHCPTGCVATALSIIMKYHGWPNRGRSQHSYNWNGLQHSVDYNTEIFDWSKMPLSYEENNFSLDQADEVSKLMYAAGVAVDMMYNENESGATANEIPYNLYRFFRYNIPSFIYKSGGCPDNKSYSDEEWFSIIKNQLDAKNPIIYSYIGHMYVVDGYDSNGLVHVNWGWDGFDNGYFAINQMGPCEGMIFSIIPEFTEEDSFETVILNDGSLRGGAQIYGLGLNINTADIAPNEDYQVAYTCITQTRKDFGPYHVALALTDSDGTVKEILTSPMLYDGMGSEDNGTLSGLNGSWGIRIDHEIDASDLIMCVIKKADEPDEYYHPIKTQYDIKPFLSVTDNEPIYSSISLYVDDNIFINKYNPISGQANIGDFEQIEDKQSEINYLANSMLIIYATSNQDVPNIKFGDVQIGKFENYKYNRNSYASVRSYYPGDVIISVIPAENMLNLNVKVEKEGTLHSKINSEDYLNIKSLKLSGPINEDDFIFINLNICNLQVLDLTDSSLIPNKLDFWAIKSLNFLKELYLPADLLYIGDEAFFFPSYGCLEVMDIPSSVTTISGNPFAIPSLDTYVTHTAEPINLETPNLTFSNVLDDRILYVPQGSKERYASADGWKIFKNIIEYDGDWKEKRNPQSITLTVSIEDGIIIANGKSDSDEYGMRCAVDIFVIEGADQVDINSISYGGNRDCTMTLHPKPNADGELLLEARKEGDGHFAPAKPVQARIKLGDIPTKIDNIIADAFNEISIYSLDGKIVYFGNEKNMPKLNRGFYIVKKGQNIEKILIN